jgi:hypothetical protein
MLLSYLLYLYVCSNFSPCSSFFCSKLYLVECRSDIYPDFPRIALWFTSLRMFLLLLRDVGRDYNDCMNFLFDRCVLIESAAAAVVERRVRW